MVQWTDRTRFQFYDPRMVRYALPVLAFILAISAMAGPSGSTLTPLAWLAALGAVGLWAYIFMYEKDHYDARAIKFEPDGTVTFVNPPPRNLDRHDTAPSYAIRKGISRITSIEYTKTADWSPIRSDRVYGSDHWYDVHVFFGDEWRVTVSRNFGQRDHAHQMTAHLNKLKAQLLRTQSQPKSAVHGTID